MKIVIDISEEEYNECRNRVSMIYQEGYLNYNLNTALVFYIGNGTPLPKNHGRLIDGDALEELCYTYEIGNSGIDNEPIIAMEYDKDGDGIWKPLFDNAPTIIEAEREEEE